MIIKAGAAAAIGLLTLLRRDREGITPFLLPPRCYIFLIFSDSTDYPFTFENNNLKPYHYESIY
jgi:hypothetical protein